MYFYFFADQLEFTKHPESQTVREGSKSVTFSCDTDSNPALTFLWTKDGIPLNITTNPRYSLSADEKQLRIKDVNKTDRGEYKCVVQKGANTVNSTDAAMLTVECKDNIFSVIHLPFNFTKSDIACYILGTCHYSLRGRVERGKGKMYCKIRTSARSSSGLRMISGPILTILGDPGAVSRDDTMVVKVFCKIETSPWALTFTEPGVLLGARLSKMPRATAHYCSCRV